MKLNYRKSGIVVFGVRKNIDTDLSYKITERLPRVKAYKYLGSMISEDLKLTESLVYL